MRILLACGEQGLLEYSGGWHALPCPLRRPSLLAADAGGVAVADAHAGELWAGGRVISTERGAEALLTDGRRALLLSGETDALSVRSLPSGQLLYAAPAGVEPQDMCLMGISTAAVCGGGDGMLHLVSAWDLLPLRTLRLPGCVQRVAWSGGALYTLCAVYEEAMMCLLLRVHPDGQFTQLLTLPGLPGALCADGMGGVWAASSETLVHVPRNAHRPCRSIGGTGLVRRMACRGGWLIACDPVLARCVVYDADGRAQLTHDGDVGQAVFLDW